MVSLTPARTIAEPNYSTKDSAASNQDRTHTFANSECYMPELYPFTGAKDYNVPVSNLFVLKHIKDNPEEENGLLIVGTIVQIINDENDCFKKCFDHEASFPYRLNEEDGEDYVKFCKMERKRKVVRSTFSLKAPLDIVDVFDKFPCRIMKAKLTVELSTIPFYGNNIKVRPKFCLNIEAKSSNISLQDSAVIRGSNGGFIRGVKFPNLSEKVLLRDKDQNVVPHVAYIMKKDESSKLELTFFLFECGVSKFVTVVCPMLLVCVMNYFKVRTSQIDVDNYVVSSEYLGNSAAFACTIVLLIEHVIPKSRKNSMVCSDTLYLVSVFTALALISVSAKETWYEKFPAEIGYCLFFTSFIIPLANKIQYYYCMRKVKRLHITDANDFIKDDRDFFEIREHNYDDFFKSVTSLVKDPENLKSKGYNTVQQSNESTTITYSNDGEKYPS